MTRPGGDEDAAHPGAGEAAAPAAAAEGTGAPAKDLLHRLADDARALRDEALNLGGAAIGVAELAGLRYPVKSYSARVSTELVRGARVDAAQMAALKQEYGLRAIVNLCRENDDDAAPAAHLGLTAMRIPILDNTTPTAEQVRAFLGFVRAHPPAYVHCEAGQGRTGTMVGCYRISVEGWLNDRAVEEAKQFGMKLPAQLEFLRRWVG